MTATGSFLDPMPDIELLGHTLDLERPELAASMNRHTSNELPRAQTSISDPPSALVVTHNDEEVPSLGAAFESQGWLVKTCPGPGDTQCPMLREQRCPLRASVDAAIVFVDPSGLYGGTGMISRLRCAADVASPAVIALEGGMDPPKYWRTRATVGARSGAKAILETLKHLLTNDTGGNG